MKVLDLSQTSKYKVTSEINHHCGGKSISKIWLASFEKGLGGFAFTDKHEDGFEEKFKSSIAFYNQVLVFIAEIPEKLPDTHSCIHDRGA
ncbi:MAG: hypothetical protein IPP49_09670 [Saprospiraceae bacterium]|nr:hypothetical protein [Saprospiraceae bacterium]